MGARRERKEIFKALRAKKPYQSRILYPAILSFKSEGEIKTFSNKNLKNLLSLDLSCKKILKVVL